MPFNSYEFVLAFVPVIVGGYWLLQRLGSRTAALGWLLLASVALYACASASSLAIIFPAILFDYLLASLMMRADASRKRLRRGMLIVGVTMNVVFLGYFKYKNFFIDTTNIVFGTHFALPPLILPIGLSFLTFQKIAFLADVHSARVKSLRLSDFLLFTLFFPRTVAGPITRYDEVVPQFLNVVPRGIAAHLSLGICLFSVGLFKKTVIADNLAQLVPATFDSLPWLPGQQLTLLTAWEGVLAYTLQLYFDFSGYSDMALGLARMLGMQLPMNFNSPFKATSIVEFWSRWHITLTRFFTDYVYTPVVVRLTRARIAKGKQVLHGRHFSVHAIPTLVAFPTLLTMTISGFWHGAGWHFVAWGALHGIYLTLNQSWRILRPRFWPDQSSHDRVMKPLGWVLTFGAVVMAFVFFRASSVAAAWSILRAMAGMSGILPYDVQIRLRWNDVLLLQPGLPFVWIIVLVLGVVLLPNALELLRRDSLNRCAGALAALLGVLGMMALGHSSEFLYERF